MRVWDTEHNTGVLVYVQFADRRIEIVADRGINARVKQADWDSVCAQITRQFRTQRFKEGALAGIAAIAALIEQHVPPAPPGKRDELPDRPKIL